MTAVRIRRRELFRGGAAGIVGMLAGCLGSDADIDPDDPPEDQIETHLDDANQYDGEILDETGESTVTVENGAVGTDYRFDPAAIRIDAGTTVVWEWLGTAPHTVTQLVIEEEAHGDGFDSGQKSGDGETWEFTFEESGVYLYVCEPHQDFQRGAVLVE